MSPPSDDALADLQRTIAALQQQLSQTRRELE